MHAGDDAELVAIWLRRSRSQSTLDGYRRDIGEFLAFLDGRPIAAVPLGRLQDYAESLHGLAPATQARKLAVVKSLYSLALKLGYLDKNPAALLEPPRLRQLLAARIMTEADTLRLIALEPKPRNRALLSLLYGAGPRATEAAGLRWRDLAAREDAGQLTVMGKGGKTRSVLLPPSVWRLLTEQRGEAGPDAPVFPSTKGGGCMGRCAVHRIVRAAARRAGLSAEVSAHWLRHAHVSHALDHGAPAHLVQQTVGHASLATTSRYAHARPNDSSARYLAI